MKPSEYKEVARKLQTLADPIRLRMISYLYRKGQGTLSEMGEKIGVDMPTISHHGTILEKSGWITKESVGRSRVCKLNTVDNGRFDMDWCIIELKLGKNGDDASKSKEKPTKPTKKPVTVGKKIRKKKTGVK